MDLIEIIKVILLGIIEGITEWLPVSSTGHILLFDAVIPLHISTDPTRAQAFMETFKVIIQLGAILAIVVMFWKKLFPFHLKKEKLESGIKTKIGVHTSIFQTWIKILIACIPAAVVGLVADDFLEAHLQTPLVISLTLIVYGVAFIVIENKKKNTVFPVQEAEAITYKQALFLGLFQLLALIPGTSRSGATIIGALLLGISRPAGTEFTFILAIPVMVGASGLKVVKFLLDYGWFTAAEFGYILIAMATAFLVSMLAVKFLSEFSRKHDFKVFGWYRIALGFIVICALVLPSMLA